MRRLLFVLLLGVLALSGPLAALPAQSRAADLDATVRAFLDRRKGTWQDLNVPESDGRVLHELVLKHRFTRALEIGTSTGHSGIWIAWALSKTGGRLTTVEIDPARHATAVANFKEAGLAAYIDARLGDAHTIVPALSGPFDFVFSDAARTGTRTTSSPCGRRSPPGAASRHTTSRSGSAGAASPTSCHT